MVWNQRDMPSFIVFCCIACIAAAWDLRHGVIPNRLLLLGFLLAFASRAALPLASGDLHELAARLLMSSAGAIVCAVVPALLFVLGAMGGGDVKLLALAGVCAGPFQGLDLEVCSFLALLLYAPGRLLFEGKLRVSLRASGTVFMNMFRSASRQREVLLGEHSVFRFGPAIVLGALMALLLDRGTP